MSRNQYGPDVFTRPKEAAMKSIGIHLVEELLWLLKWPSIFAGGLLLYAVMATGVLNSIEHHVQFDSDPCSAGCGDSR
jgi:hypothetical protein